MGQDWEDRGQLAGCGGGNGDKEFSLGIEEPRHQTLLLRQGSVSGTEKEKGNHSQTDREPQ